nr:HAD family hydrolase [Glycomyces xiaoerkulensis]
MIYTDLSAVILDFDGPVCSVFSGYNADLVARELTATIRLSDVAVSQEIGDLTDPMEVLRVAYSRLPEDTSQTIEDQLCQAELKAISTATSTPGTNSLLADLTQSGTRIAIASNNSAEAIEYYLEIQGISQFVSTTVGRPYRRPDLMKPNPQVVNTALESLGIKATAALFVGDSPSDVSAGKAANIRTIGYANRPGKRKALTAAGASSVIGHMTDLRYILGERLIHYPAKMSLIALRTRSIVAPATNPIGSPLTLTCASRPISAVPPSGSASDRATRYGGASIVLRRSGTTHGIPTAL